VQSNPDGPDGRGEADDSDAAWRAIVENYGERAEIDDPPAAPPAAAAPAAPFGGRFAAARGLGDPKEDADDPVPVAEDEGFEPPAPPPLPKVAPDRLAAWSGIFGSPAVLLAALIFSIEVPAFVAYLLVTAFVGGFVYLVAKMPRGPRDPWDDGAQI
jgi:hypothetical protein